MGEIAFERPKIMFKGISREQMKAQIEKIEGRSFTYEELAEMDTLKYFPDLAIHVDDLLMVLKKNGLKKQVKALEKYIKDQKQQSNPSVSD